MLNWWEKRPTKNFKWIPSKQSDLCDTYWGSHGCFKQRGHEGHHVCTCCEDPSNHATDHLDTGCVGTYPYYGEDTNFFGDDVS